eukprot:gene27132-2361_t
MFLALLLSLSIVSSPASVASSILRGSTLKKEIKSSPLLDIVRASDVLTETEKIAILEVSEHSHLPPKDHLSISHLQEHNGVPDGVQCETKLWCDEAQLCSRVCKRGTVVIDPWLKHSLEYQHADPPMKTNNQALILTDQMNLDCGGFHSPLLDKVVRAMNSVAKMFGHNIQWDASTVGCSPSLSSIATADQRGAATLYLVPYTICHAVPCFSHHLPRCTSFLTPSATLYLVSHTICHAVPRSLHHLPRYTSFLTPSTMLIAQITQYFPEEMILTPAELAAMLGGGDAPRAPMPSIDALVAQGKRMMVMSSTNYHEAMEKLVFTKPSLLLCDIHEASVTYFRGVESGCKIERRDGEWDIDSGPMTRMYGPLDCDFHLDTSDRLFINNSLLSELTSCGVSIPSIDDLTPTIVSAHIWSWAPGHPPNKVAPESSTVLDSGVQTEERALHTVRETEDVEEAAEVGTASVMESSIGSEESAVQYSDACAVVSGEDGRWRVTKCSASTFLACRRLPLPSGATQVVDPWVVSPKWRLCPLDCSWDAPRSARDNLMLLNEMRSKNVTAAWLPLRGPDYSI